MLKLEKLIQFNTIFALIRNLHLHLAEEHAFEIQHDIFSRESDRIISANAHASYVHKNCTPILANAHASYVHKNCTPIL